MVERVVLDGAARVAQLPRIPAAPATALARLSMKLARTCFSARCSCGSASAARGILLEAVGGDLHGSAFRRFADGGTVGHAGEHLGDMAGLRRRSRRASACRPCSGGSRDRRRAGCRRRLPAIASVFRVDDGVGDVGILDAERAAEAAADVGVRAARVSSSPSTPARRRRGWSLDAELAQARAGIVIGDAAVVRRGRPLSTPSTSTRKETSSCVFVRPARGARSAQAGSSARSMRIVLADHAGAGA